MPDMSDVCSRRAGSLHHGQFLQLCRGHGAVIANAPGDVSPGPSSPSISIFSSSQMIPFTKQIFTSSGGNLSCAASSPRVYCSGTSISTASPMGAPGRYCLKFANNFNLIFKFLLQSDVGYGHMTMSCAHRQSAQEGFNPQHPSFNPRSSQVSRRSQSGQDGK